MEPQEQPKGLKRNGLHIVGSQHLESGFFYYPFRVCMKSSRWFIQVN